jgi:hypothetical protein
MPVVRSPRTPLERGGEVFQRSKTQSFFEVRPSRPLSEATDIIDTDFEDESDFDDDSVPKRSFDSVSDTLASRSVLIDGYIRMIAGEEVIQRFLLTTKHPLRIQVNHRHSLNSDLSQLRDLRGRISSELLNRQMN